MTCLSYSIFDYSLIRFDEDTKYEAFLRIRQLDMSPTQ